MFHTTHRSTATGRTAFALLALLALLVSAFSLAAPALGAHDVDGPAVDPVTVSPEDPEGYSFQGQNVVCPAGTTELKFETDEGDLADGDHTDSVVIGTTTVTVMFTVAGNTITEFTVTNGLAAYVFVKASDETNVYNYSAQTGGGIAHDDGLFSPTADGISHASFCLIAVTTPPPPVTGDLVINKTSGASTALAGVTFTLTGTGFATRTDVTDASGQASFDDLPVGTYTLTETTPAGHQPAGPWTVTVSATGVVSVSGLTPNQNGSFNIANQLIVPPTGDLLINKTSGASTALAGVTFTLSGTGFTTRTDVTDASGQANFDDLPAGTYTLTETTPAGHQPAGPWTVTVSATGVVTVSGLTANANGSFNIANQLIVTVPPTGDLLINKTSGTAALAGVTFTLTGTGFTTRTDVTDASGQANFDDLPVGTYTLSETTPADFQAAGPWTVTVSATGVVTVSGLTANANGSFTIVNTRAGTQGTVSTPSPTPVVRTGTLTSTGVPNTATTADAGLTAVAVLGALMLLSAGVFVSTAMGGGRRRR